MHGWSRIELAPLLKRRVFSSTQPAETRERVSEALKEHRLTWKGGRVDAELNRARFGALSVCTLRYGAEVHIEPDRLQDFMLVQVPLRGRARIECGTDCVDAHPDCAAVIAPNRALKLHWEAGCEQLLLKIPRGKLEAIGHRIFGDAAARPLDFSPALRLDTPVGAAWRSMMTSLIHLLPTLDDGAPRPPPPPGSNTWKTRSSCTCSTTSPTPGNATPAWPPPCPAASPRPKPTCAPTWPPP